MRLSDLGPKQIDRARAIFDAAAPFGAEAVAGALMTAAAESSYWLFANDGSTRRADVPARAREVARESLAFEHDRVAPQLPAGTPAGTWDTTADSVGHFQQRPMYGYGTVAELMDPAESTRIFLRGSRGDRTRCFLDAPKTLSLPQRCQWTQGSEYPTGENYEPMAVVVGQLMNLFTRGKDWLDMATKEEVKAAFAEALEGFKTGLVSAIHDDIVGILRSDEFRLSTGNIAEAVHARQITSAVNGKDYPLSAIVGWTDMHASNIEAAMRFLVDRAGGEIKPGSREGNFTVDLKKKAV